MTTEAPKPWARGFEIELMAPKGASREDLAKRLADDLGGRVRRVFYPQSEIATTTSLPGYETATLAFQVLDAGGRTFAILADDITLDADIDHDVRGKDGWYRILTPHKLIVDLVERTCSAEADLESVLEPIAEIYGVDVSAGDRGLRAVRSRSGMVAMALPLAGDRERACEIISPPLGGDDAFVERYLARVLETGEALGFFVPKESATHVHFDGAPLRSALAIRNLVRVFTRFGDHLKQVCKPNPACTRLGAWPDELVALACSDAFLTMSWPEAARAIDKSGVVKWCDFNVLNLVDPFATKRTFEVRILRTSFDAERLASEAAMFASLLRRIVESPPLPDPGPEARGTPEELEAAFSAFVASGRW